MKPKSNSMVKFGIAMLGAYLLAALVFFLFHDNGHSVMFLAGSVIWIAMIFIHDRNSKHGD